MKWFAAGAALAAMLYSTANGETMYDLMTTAGIENVNEDMKNKAHEVFPGSDNCFTTGQVREAPRSLSFCHKFNDGACCVPQLDDENNDFFGMLTNLGLSCRIRGDIRVDPLATFYCLNCDPEQPSYIRLGMSSLKDEEDSPPYSVASNNAINSGDYNPASSVHTGRAQKPDSDKGTMLVDLDWAVDEFKASPLLAGPDKRLAKCGLLVSVPCQDDQGNELEGRDRYMCGDDLIIPSNPDHGAIVWNSSDGNCGGNCVPLINASLESFLNIPSLGTPLIDEAYYFKLVQGTCTDEQAEEYLNPHCLRTSTQIETLVIKELQRNFNNARLTYKDWVCANAAANGAANINISSNYCDNISCRTNESAVNISKAKLEEPCCCGTWHDEKAFSSASIIHPLLAVTSAMLAVLVLH